jgi:23S rRNA (cytosine1962-C5)-methyltransferase
LIKYFAKGRRVLNSFCYTGGFSIYAIAHGAASVDSIDSSKSALELLDRNIAINELQTEHRTIQADCLQFLQDVDNKYDLIVLDPPAFIKHRRALTGGLKGYETINTLALEQIAPGGILFTFSCSQHLTRSLFMETVQKAAIRAGRTTRIIHQLHAAPCHPMSIYHPEGEYLKGMVLHVE